MNNFWGHLNTVNHHRTLVMKGCFKIGLYKQGLLHDLSKYSPTEFLVGVKYYQGHRSPNNAEREDRGYSGAWLHHKGRNKHHYEYWVDYSCENPDGSITPVPMPRRYIAEMFVDRVSAAKIYKKDAYTDNSPLEYYRIGKDKIVIHPDTRRKLEYLLKMLSKYGEDRTFKYIKKVFLRNEKNY